MLIKSFGKNTVIYGIGNIVLRGTALLLIPIYTHTLSVKDYGLLSTLLITTQFMLILMNMGMRVALVRFTSEFEQKNQMGSLMGASILINLFGGLAVTGTSALFLLPLYRTILHTQQVFDYVMLTCFSSFMQSLLMHIVTYYRAKNEALKFTMVTIAAAILLILLTIIFLSGLHLGVKSVLVAQIIAHGLVLVIALINLMRQIGLIFSGSVTWQLLRFGFPLIFSITGQSFTGAATMYILSYLIDLESVAIFSLGQKLSQIMVIILIVPFQLSFQPFVFANLTRPGIKETMARIFTYFMFCISMVSIFILLASRLFFPFIAPPEYSFAYILLLLLLPATGLVGITNFAEALLNCVKKTNIQGIVVAISSVLNLVLNFLLIPRLGLYGAVITLYVTNLSMSLLLLIFGLRAFPVRLEFKRIGISTLMLVTFLGSILMLQKCEPIIFYSITLSLPILSLIFMYYLGFFDDREKVAIKNFYRAIRFRLLKIC